MVPACGSSKTGLYYAAEIKCSGFLETNRSHSCHVYLNRIIIHPTRKVRFVSVNSSRKVKYRKPDNRGHPSLNNAIGNCLLSVTERDRQSQLLKVRCSRAGGAARRCLRRALGSIIILLFADFGPFSE